MNKKFFTICFITSLWLSSSAMARVVEINQMDQQEPVTSVQALSAPVSGMPDPNNLKEVLDFFRKRFEDAPVSHTEETGSLDVVGTTDVQHSAEYIEQLQEQNKSIFEKIYDQAMKKISDTFSDGPEQQAEDIRYYELAPTPESPKAAALPNIPLVNVTLPGGRQVVAPAREHIPYLLVSLNILPNGLVEVEEEVTVVANGKKLKNGLIRTLPKFTTSRAGVRKKLDITLLSAEINGRSYPYIVEEIGNNFYIKPKKDYQLTPGVYTFRFKYLIDRKIWQYDDFAELYWDIAGSSWNLVITSANAVISLPQGQKFTGQNILIGRGRRLFNNRAMMVSLADNALGFASTTPLLPGEGMHIIVSLDKNLFLKPDLNQRLMWLITDYGSVMLAIFGFLSVFISYLLSWRDLKVRKPRLLGRFKSSAPILRYLLKNMFDRVSFVSGILELYQKNVIDIQKQDAAIMLIKRTDQFQNLNQSEKNVMNHLFGKEDSVISMEDKNMLKFRRAYAALERGTVRSVKILKWQLNIGYLFFSVMMLVLTALGIAGLSVNPAQTGLILLSAIITLAFYTWIFRLPFAGRVKKYIFRTLSGIFILLSILFAGVYVSFICAFLIAATVYVIFEYSSLFAKRSGVLKSKIKETEELSRYLQTNASQINTGTEFSAKQPTIYALDLVPFYPRTEHNAAVYKLDLAAEMEQIYN